MADANRYIRPIIRVRIERTGRDQREGGCINAQDVRTSCSRPGSTSPKSPSRRLSRRPESAREPGSPGADESGAFDHQETTLQESWDCRWRRKLHRSGGPTLLKDRTTSKGVFRTGMSRRSDYSVGGSGSLRGQAGDSPPRISRTGLSVGITPSPTEGTTDAGDRPPASQTVRRTPSARQFREELLQRDRLHAVDQLTPRAEEDQDPARAPGRAAGE